MYKLYKNEPANRKRRDFIQIAIPTIMLVLSALAFDAHAQEGSQGNTTIFAGAQMSFFGNHNFITGGGGAQPGIILTERLSGNFGILNFIGNSLTSTGANASNFVDGYVRKYGTGSFIFPVGDGIGGGNYIGQFAASDANGVMGAYFHVNPTSAVTDSRFSGANYPPLPIGGPFPVSSVAGVKPNSVSTVEYWDIDGANPTQITLTWNALSGVAAMTNNNLQTLTIVGWDGFAWVRLDSEYDFTDVTSGLGSTLTRGSITTTGAPFAPDTYTAYTLAAAGPDLSPRITINPNIARGITDIEVMVTVSEVDFLEGTNGSQIRVKVSKSTNLSSLTWDNTRTTNYSGSTPVQNSRWTRLPDGTDPFNYVFTTSDIIPAGGDLKFVFKIKFDPKSSGGTFNFLTELEDFSGGELDNINNNDSETLSFFPN